MFTNQTKLSIGKALITKKSPYYIQYYINGQCNLMCKQCNIVETNSGLKNATLDEVEKIANNIRKIGGGIVLLTGGEPYLRKDLPEIVTIFKKNKLDVRLQTAGHKVATDELLKRTYDAGARDINISLDSLIYEKQEYINSVPNSWHEAIKSISNVSRIYQESAITSFGCVLSKFNYYEIPSILEFATSIGWYLSLVPVHITDPSLSMGFRSYDNDFVFRKEDIPRLESVFERLYKMKKKGYLLFDSLEFLESSLEFIKTGKPTWRKNDVCDSPFLYFAVRPNGDMMVCCDWEIPGKKISLIDPEFPEIYKSKSLIDSVVDVTSACNGCHYGSYPEVTISVRSPMTFAKRMLLTLTQKNKIIPKSYEEMLNLIEVIKKKNIKDYEIMHQFHEDTVERLDIWKDKSGRKKLQKEDMNKRKLENRIRKTNKIKNVK